MTHCRDAPLACAVHAWDAAVLTTTYGGHVQDHKAVGEGDTGPNTGGMGAYSPAPVVTPAVEAQVRSSLPALQRKPGHV